MRSIDYIVNKNPKCFADCVDFKNNNRLKNVFIKLVKKYEINVNFHIQKLYCEFIWDFENRLIRYDEIMGGIIKSEPKDRQLKSIENANRRLERRLNDFKLFNIEYNFLSENKFIYEEI